MPTTAATLTEIQVLARPIVERVVWCTVATADADGPRTRLLHPVWWWDQTSLTALVSTRPTPVKVRHLAHQATVSCFYWDPRHDTVAIDATATWVAPDERAAAWERIRAVDPPVGFDPTLIWPDGPSAPDCAFLRLRAHRVVATPAGQQGWRWTDRTGTPPAGSAQLAGDAPAPIR